MAAKRKILFLGEAFRADAITWTEGLKELGDFEIVTWELRHSGSNWISRIRRFLEYLTAVSSIRKVKRLEKPDMVIAERTTSYGFLAALSGIRPIAIAQQGRTDLWPENSVTIPLKRLLQHRAFSKADLIHAWGPVMTVSMRQAGVDMKKVMVLPKGIHLENFHFKNSESEPFRAVVTRSLQPEYRHDTILEAFAILNQKGIDFVLTIVGDGTMSKQLQDFAIRLGIADKVNFTGRIPNTELPKYLGEAGYYISMPVTEGVSASLFEAMASGCYPIVTDLPGNRSWIVSGENGQLVPSGNAAALAQQIEWAMHHPEIRNKALLENRAFVERHADYHTNMKKIADRYHELINQFGTNVRH